MGLSILPSRSVFLIFFLSSKLLFYSSFWLNAKADNTTHAPAAEAPADSKSKPARAPRAKKKVGKTHKQLYSWTYPTTTTSDKKVKLVCVAENKVTKVKKTTRVLWLKLKTPSQSTLAEAKSLLPEYSG